jgi:transposase
MLGNLSRASKVFLICGYTDMRKSIDGLMSIIAHTYQMDPYSSALYMFCGKRSDRIKILIYEQTGFTLLYHRLESGRYQWPRSQKEARLLNRQEFKWLLEGINIDQPKAIKPIKHRDI